MKKKILILNGVNLNALGTREVDLYGYIDFASYFMVLKNKFPEIDMEHYQSNSLEDIVETMYCHQYDDGIILNPGAYTHTSIVLADAIKAIPAKVVELHISNVFSREYFRRKSFISSACAGSISGFGLKGYELAIRSLID